MPLLETRPLSSFVQVGVEEIFHAKDLQSFERAFNKLIADDAAVTMNGQRITRSRYKEHLWKEQLGELGNPSLKVRFEETIENIKIPNALLQTGAVGTFYEVYTEVPGEEIISRVSVIMVVDRKGPKIVGDLEGRIVTSVNEVSRTSNLC